MTVAGLFFLFLRSGYQALVMIAYAIRNHPMKQTNVWPATSLLDRVRQTIPFGLVILDELRAINTANDLLFEEVFARVK